MKVFISWAKEPSGSVARALHEWLPDVIQTAEPWISTTDIGAGERWSVEMAQALTDSRIGILCVTDANQTEPWLAFEAGALAKTVEKAFVCPYLIGINPTDLTPGPLTQFQAKTANKGGTWELVQRINDAAKDRALESARLRRLFDLSWPTLESHLKTLPPARTEPRRSVSDMVAETLDLVRALSRGGATTPEIGTSFTLQIFEFLARGGHKFTREQLEFIARLPPRGQRRLLVDLQSLSPENVARFLQEVAGSGGSRPDSGVNAADSRDPSDPEFTA